MKHTFNFYTNLFNSNLLKLQFKAVVQLIDTIELFPVNIYNDGAKQQIQFICNEKKPHGFQRDFMPIDDINLIGILQSTELIDKNNKLIFEGDIQFANELLGHRFTLEGMVVHGEKRGRTGEALPGACCRHPRLRRFSAADCALFGRERGADRRRAPPDCAGSPCRARRGRRAGSARTQAGSTCRARGPTRSPAHSRPVARAPTERFVAPRDDPSGRQSPPNVAIGTFLTDFRKKYLSVSAAA